MPPASLSSTDLDQASHGPIQPAVQLLEEIHLHTQLVNNLYYYTIYCPGHGAVSETLWPETLGRGS